MNILTIQCPHCELKMELHYIPHFKGLCHCSNCHQKFMMGKAIELAREKNQANHIVPPGGV